MTMESARVTDNGSWKKVTEATERLPPFSPVLNRLIATLADEDVSLGDLAVLIEKDAVLAGNVLRVVNSALYGRRGTVNSVRHAVSLMGILKLRNFALSFAVSQMWTHLRMPKKWSSRQFNLHSLAAAVLADMVALETGVPYTEGAFIAGLLHDIGRLVIAIAFPADFEGIYSGQSDTHPAEQCEIEKLGFSHCEVSGAVLERWNLPVPIQRAVAHHHWPDRANGGQLHLAHVVAAIDAYLHYSGCTILPGTDAEPIPSAEPLKRLGLGDRLNAVLSNCMAEYESLTSVL